MAGEFYSQPINQPEDITNLLREKLRSPEGGPVAIFIAGPMGSGKNHLANELLAYREKFIQAAAVNTAAQQSSMPETAEDYNPTFLEDIVDNNTDGILQERNDEVTPPFTNDQGDQRPDHDSSGNIVHLDIDFDVIRRESDISGASKWFRLALHYIKALNEGKSVILSGTAHYPDTRKFFSELHKGSTFAADFLSELYYKTHASEGSNEDYDDLDEQDQILLTELGIRIDSPQSRLTYDHFKDLTRKINESRYIHSFIGIWIHLDIEEAWNSAINRQDHIDTPDHKIFQNWFNTFESFGGLSTVESDGWHILEGRAATDTLIEELNK